MYADITVLRTLDSDWNAILFEDGIVADAFRAAAASLGYSGAAELVGMPYTGLVQQRITSSLMDEIQHALRREGRWVGELKLRKRSGDWFWAECTVRLLDEERESARVLCWFRDVTRRKELEQQLFVSGCYDTLTSLPNRSYFGYRLSIEVDKAARLPSRKLLLLTLDVDRFKIINDSLGHAFGDRVLAAIVRRMQGALDESTLLARTGGDSFAVLMKLDTNESFEPMVDRLLQAVAEPMFIEQNELSVTFSVGASFCPRDTKRAEKLVRNAELALANAKEQGRNTLLYFDEKMNASSMRRLLLPNYLRRAIEREEFEVYYQPKQRLSDGGVYGAEALIRWHSPDLGWVLPTEFIPVAEELGLIGRIGEYVMASACAQARAWQLEGRPIAVSVNLSSKQFQQQELNAIIASILSTAKLPPELLEVELTESSVMQHPKDSALALKRLKDLGVSVSVDDFGTGFSSLNYLSLFPLDTLKIDKSFVQAMALDTKNMALVQAIIDLGHKLGLRVVAEGVETEEQRRWLQSFGCDGIQGYLLSPPIPPAQFQEQFLR
ncbi:bifunctional diguanylate cyclase/phosphodiesterase [Paenibacillus sp.]|uniref:putative bifunctional diguanylate cyclase/phosphodiesterase n=1 Tax=Paenibacillus sp. TaxID=58172 RepID=UPI002D26D4A4|nr:bifunctional diguanylate cyclase/phosphodiesterase [Paenibacillus sp.]HZG84167.1 bifunctional diguanylate cyclase/phosphodiesterase [Paenibacillus sp.]